MNQGTHPIEATPSAYAYPLLIKQLLHTPILYAPDQQIVYRDLIRYTYKEFYNRIQQLASALSSAGVGPGDTVAVLDWDSHRYLECFFAIPMMGAILHTVNIRMSREQILYSMEHAEDTVVLVNEEFLPLLQDHHGALKKVRSFVLLKDEEGVTETSIPISEEYESMLSRAEKHFDFPEFHEDTQATLFYTTGTTGSPKGVYYSHRQLVLHTLSVAVAMGSYTAQGRFQSGDVYMPLTPMFHVHAWGFPYVATMLGAKQVYPGRFLPEIILRLVEKEDVTFSHCVPTILHAIINSPDAKAVDFSRWKVMVGGASFPKGLALEALQMGMDVSAGYGMSETCPVLTVANLKPHMLGWDRERQADIRIKTGFPIPLVALRVVDQAGKDLPKDGHSPGEIVVRAPWLTQGYFKEQQKSEDLWKGGWLHTGDIAHQDGEGFVHITDRMKDVIKSGGEWISSLELENLISQHEAVSQVAVFGIPDAKWGERPAAMVILKRPYEEEAFSASLNKHLQQYLDRGVIAKWALPEKVYVVKNIPKTSVGKINKKEIRERFADDTISDLWR